jgi:hypothetical protein
MGFCYIFLGGFFMAYKFQLGAAKLSGSIEQTDGSSIKAQTEFQIGSVAVDETELGILEGATVTTAELNILDGVTSTAAELNLVDGSSAGSVVNSKAVIYGASGEVNGSSIQVSGQDVIDSSGDLFVNNINGDGTLSLNDGNNTVSNTELLILDGATVTTAELNILDGATLDVNELNILDGVTSTTAELNILDGVTSTTAELNLLDGSAADTIVNSKAVIYGSAGEVNASSFDISGNEVVDSSGNAYFGTIEAGGDIDFSPAGAYSIGASVGANTLTLGGATSTVRIAGDLDVVGTLNRVTETELLIEDKAIIVASGSANAAAAAGAGLIVDIATGDMAFLYQANGENIGGVDASSSGDIFVASGSAGLIDVQAAAFYGDGSNLTNVSATGLEETVQSVSSTGTINISNGLQVLADASAASITLTLPSAGTVEGKMLKIKRSEGSANTVTIDTSAGTIDGESSIILESAFAGVSIISDGTDYYVM